MTVVVGLVGGAGSGKTTAAHHLCNLLVGREYVLADPVKSITMDLYGFTRGQVDGSQEVKRTVNPVIGISPRQGMQRVGDALRRAFGEDYLVAHTWDRILLDQPTLAVVSDVRYLNEAAYLRRTTNQVILVRMEAPQSDAAHDPHVSEQEWRCVKTDFSISRGRHDLADFRELVKSLVPALNAHAR